MKLNILLLHRIIMIIMISSRQCVNIDSLNPTVIDQIITNNPNTNYMQLETDKKFHLCSTESSRYDKCLEESFKYDLSILNLDDCLTTIRNKNSLSPTEELYIAIYDYKTPYHATQVEYEVFYKTSSTLQQATLNDCISNTIKVIKPVMKNNITLKGNKIYEKFGYNIYNSTDPFYTNICLPVTSDNNTDVLMKYRYDHFFTETYYCEIGCTLLNLNLSSYRVECECLINLSKITTARVFITDTGTKPETNDFDMQFYLCYLNVITLSIFVNNFGNYIILGLFLIQLFCMCYFICDVKSSLFNPLRSLIPAEGNPPKRNVDMIIQDIKDDIRYANAQILAKNKTRDNPYKNKIETSKNKLETSKNKVDISLSTQDKFHDKNASYVHSESSRKQINDEFKIIEVKKAGDCYCEDFIMDYNYMHNQIMISEHDDRFNVKDIPLGMDIIIQRKLKLKREKRLAMIDVDDDDKSNKEEGEGEGEEEENKEIEDVLDNDEPNMDDKLPTEPEVIDPKVIEYNKFLEKIKKYESMSFCVLYGYIIRKRHILFSILSNQKKYENRLLKITLFIISLSFHILIAILLSFNMVIEIFYLRQNKLYLEYMLIFGAMTAVGQYIMMKIVYCSMKYRPKVKVMERTVKTLTDITEITKQVKSRIAWLKVRFTFYYIFMIIWMAAVWYSTTAFCGTYINTQITCGMMVGFSIGVAFVSPFIFCFIPVIFLRCGIKNKKKCCFRCSRGFLCL